MLNNIRTYQKGEVGNHMLSLTGKHSVCVCVYMYIYALISGHR